MDLNLILTIVFIVILVLIGLAALIGLWKGFWKTSFKTIFRCALFLVIVFCAQPITNAICSINFHSTFGLNFSFDGIQLTTLDEFLTNIIMVKGNVSPVTGQSLYSTCSALAHSILSFAIFFVLVILVLLFSSLFSTIFYHLIFKHFISRRIRKKKKIRWLGGIFGLLDGVVCAVMLIAPISSLGNVVLENRETLASVNDAEIVNNDQYKFIDDALTAYDNSILGTVLERLSPISEEIMSNVVDTEIDGVKINFFDEINSLIGIVNPVLSNVDSFANNELTLKLSTLLAKDNIEDIITLISESNLIISLIPGLVSMGSAYISDPQISSIIEDLDFNDIDWKNDIAAISAFYGKLYDAGLFKDIPDIGKVQDIKFNLDINSIEKYAEAISSLSDFQVINKNLASAMTIAAKEVNTSLKANILPENKDAYDGMDWSHELVCITNALLKLMDALDIDSFEIQNINIQEKIEAALKDKDKLAVIKQALCGTEASGETEATTGLLDLKMLDQINIDNLLVSTLSTVEELKAYISEEMIVEALRDVNLKDEFGSLLDIVSLIYDIPMGEDNNIDLRDDASIEILIDVVDNVKKSNIIKSIFPNFIKNALNEADISDQVLFGLSVDNMSFDFEDFDVLCEEIKDILNVIPDAMDLMDDLGGDNPDITKLDTTKVKNILVTLYSSTIVNTTHRVDGTGGPDDVLINYNFNALINGFMDSDAFSELNVTLPKDLNSIEWLDTEDGSGNVIKGEISHLLDIIDFLKVDGKFILDDNFDLDNITGDLLVKTVELVQNSELLSPSLAGILNDALQETFESLNVSVDFNRVTSWTNEAECLAVVLDQIKIIGSDGAGNLDIENIDWLNQDPDRLNAMLTALTKLQIMSVYRSDTGEYIDTFGDFVSKLFTSEEIKKILGDNIDEENFYSYDKQTGQPLSWAWSKTTTTITKGEGEDQETLVITDTGEIASIIGILSELDEELIDDINAGIVESNVLKDILYKIIDTNTLSTYLTAILENSILTVPDIELNATNKISISKMNLEVFDNMSTNEKKTEIDTLLKIYEETKTSGDGGTSPLQDLMTNIDSLGEQELNILKGILDNIASLKTFTEAKIGEYLSLHEDVISSLLNYVSIDQMVTDNLNNAERAKRSMYSIIINIETWVDTDDTSNDGENTKLIGLLNEIAKNADINLNNLNDVNEISPNAIKSILMSMNASGLLHQAIPTFMKEIFTNINIDSIISVNNVVYYPIEYFTHLSTSDEDVAFWNSEINSIFDLINTLYIEETGEYVDTKSISFSDSIMVGDTPITLDQLLVPISHLNLLANNKEYIIYNFIAQTDSATSATKLSDLIREMPVRYGDSVAARIRKLFFPIGQTDEDLSKQTRILTSFLTTMTSNIDKSFSSGASGGSLLDPSFGFNFILGPVDAEYTTDTNGIVTVDSYSRSLFASEIVAGFMFKGFEASIIESDKTEQEKTELINRIENAFYELDSNTGMDYKNINIVEAYGIQGLLRLASADFASFNGNVASIAGDLVEAFSMMGSTDETVSALVKDGMSEYDALHVYTHNQFYSSNEANRVNNSILASTLLDIYVPSTILTTLNTLIRYGQIRGYSHEIGSEQFVFGEFAKALAETYLN